MERFDSQPDSTAADRLDYRLVRSSRKTVAIIVHRDDTLEVRCPHRYAKWRIDRLIREKEDWIRQKRKENLDCIALPDLGLYNDPARSRLLQQTRDKVEAILHTFTGARPARLSIRLQRSRWGSCSSKKTVSINLYAGLLPERLLEYIVYHECCHLLHLDHSAAFWQALVSRMPDALSRRAALQRYHIPDKADKF